MMVVERPKHVLHSFVTFIIELRAKPKGAAVGNKLSGTSRFCIIEPFPSSFASASYNCSLDSSVEYTIE